MTSRRSSKKGELTFSLLLFLSGCNYNEPTLSVQRLEANLQSIQQDFVNVRCVRCHEEAKDANRHVSLVNIAQIIEPSDGNFEDGVRYLIKPGCPNQSFFLSIIKEGKMPPGQKVSSEEIDTIAKFIRNLNPSDEIECNDEPGNDDDFRDGHLTR